MFRRSFTVGLILILGLLVFSQLAQAQPQAPQLQPQASQVERAPVLTITNMTLASEAECPTTSENDCVNVTWTIQPKPADTSLLTYELSGQMTYEAGSSTNNGTPVNDGKATKALVKFFHSGSGAIKEVKITLKLFIQKNPLGPKQLVTETTQTKRF